MSVKKTSSPLSSGSEAVDRLGAQEKAQRSSQVEKTFDAALSELAGQIDRTGTTNQPANPTQTAFREIADRANLETPEGAIAAVRESAEFMVTARLKEDFQNSEEGRKVSSELSEFIAKDPFLHRKILGILQKLKQ